MIGRRVAEVRCWLLYYFTLPKDYPCIQSEEVKANAIMKQNAGKEEVIVDTGIKEK